MQRCLGEYSLRRDAVNVLLLLQWTKWEEGHARRIANDIHHLGSAISSEPAFSVIRDIEFMVVRNEVKVAIIRQYDPK